MLNTLSRSRNCRLKYPLEQTFGKVCSLCSEQDETDLCTAFTLHMRAWGKLKSLSVLVDSPFWRDFGQALFCKAWHAFVISLTKSENWDGNDFNAGFGTRCSEYSEWTSPIQ